MEISEKLGLGTRKSKADVDKDEKEVTEIMDGLVGDLRTGQKYYFFTISYHYIGRIEGIRNGVITLDPSDAEIVMSAGSDNQAVSKILQGKMKPEVSEKPGKRIKIFAQSLTAVIEF